MKIEMKIEMKTVSNYVCDLDLDFILVIETFKSFDHLNV